MLESALLCLSMAVYYEARSEPLEGQHAVAYVVLNRAGYNVKNICREVYKPKQFSPFNEPRAVPPKHKPAWQLAQAVAKVTITLGQRGDLTNGATHFHATYVKPKWSARCQDKQRIGLHIFCRLPL